MINIEDLDSSLLKIDKKPYKNIGIYNIGYITIKKIDDYENIHSVNPLYPMTHEVIRHIECNFVEEKSGSKYLVFDSMELHSAIFQIRMVFHKICILVLKLLNLHLTFLRSCLFYYLGYLTSFLFHFILVLSIILVLLLYLIWFLNFLTHP